MRGRKFLCTPIQDHVQTHLCVEKQVARINQFKLSKSTMQATSLQKDIATFLEDRTIISTS